VSPNKKLRIKLINLNINNLCLLRRQLTIDCTYVRQSLFKCNRIHLNRISAPNYRAYIQLMQGTEIQLLTRDLESKSLRGFSLSDKLQLGPGIALQYVTVR
jgi:hypothetical protein